MTCFAAKSETIQSQLPSENESEMEQRIIQQAEFYLSEDYLMKNAYLLRQVARKRNGFLSIKFISSFKRMRELSQDWQTTAKALGKSEKLELSEDEMKVRRKVPLTPFISSIKSIKSVLVTSSDELTVSGITSWLSNYGEIVYVQVIKPGMEIPDNLRAYSTKHSELGNRPVGVVEFDTPEAAHRCCRELDSGIEGEARVCLLGTRIRSFARHRRKKEPARFEPDCMTIQKEPLNKERLSPGGDSSTDSAISSGSSQDGNLPRDMNPVCHQWPIKPIQSPNRYDREFSTGYNMGVIHRPVQSQSQQRPHWSNRQSEQSHLIGGNRQFGNFNQSGVNLDQLRNHQQQLLLQEKLLHAARVQYQNALYIAQQRHAHAQQQRFEAAHRMHMPIKNSNAPPPPGLEPESEISEGFSHSIHNWLDKLSMD